MNRPRVLTCLVLTLILSVLRAAPAAAALISFANDHNNIGTGDTVTTTVVVVNPDAAVVVDAYLVLVQPDQSLIFFEFNGGLVPHPGNSDPSTWVKLVSNLALPGGLNTRPVSIASFTGTGGQQPGLYQWIFALVRAGTFTQLDFKTAPFFLSRFPVLPLLGSYTVNSSIPSLGSSGSGTALIADSAPGTLTMTASGFSAGFTSSYNATATLNPQGDASWAMQGNIFGTIVHGSGTIDASGYLTGSIDTVTVGPFIKSITNVSGVFANGQYHQTQTTTFTDGASGTESLTATHQFPQSDCLFNWAERSYASLFAPAGAMSNTLAQYYYRHYPQTNAYLATSAANNHVYYLGPLSNNSILDVGALSGWLVTSGCQ